MAEISLKNTGLLGLRKAAICAVVFPLLMSGQVARAETIFGAMEKAYVNNPDLNSSRVSLRSNDENVTIAKAGYRPQVGITLGGTQNDVSAIHVTGNPLTSTDYFKADAQVSVTQMIFDGFQTLNSVRSAEAGIRSSQETLKANEIQILLSAAQAYADVARDQSIVAIRKQNLQFLREQLKAAKARLDVGEGTKTDVSQAEAQLAGSEALLAAAVAQLKQSEATYLQIVGEMPKDVKQPQRATKSMPSSLDQAVKIGIVDHPTVLAAEHAVDSSKYDVKTAEGSLLPGVSLQAGLGRHVTNNPSTSSDFNYNAATVTAQVKIPLYQGGSEYGKIRKAKEAEGARELQVDVARLNVRKQIMTAYALMDAANSGIAAAKKQIEAAKLALQGVIEERNVGQKTTLDVLNAQTVVLNAQESMVGYQRNLVVASYSVIAATGQLTVKSQGLKVAEYDPQTHYDQVKDKWIGTSSPDAK